MKSKLTVVDYIVITILIILMLCLGLITNPKADPSAIELSRKVCAMNDLRLIHIEQRRYKKALHDNQPARLKISIVCGE